MVHNAEGTGRRELVPARSYVTLRYQPHPLITFDLNHNYFSEIPTFDERLLATGLVDKLLFEGPSAGVRLDLPVDVRALLEQTVTLAGAQAADAGAPISFVINAPADLPSWTMDHDQMLQVLLNLVRNAMDVMPAGGTVTLSARHRDFRFTYRRVRASEVVVADKDIPLFSRPVRVGMPTLTYGSRNTWWDMPAGRHNQAADLSFADGHVEHWRWRVPKVFGGWTAYIAPGEQPDYDRVSSALRQTFR